MLQYRVLFKVVEIKPLWSTPEKGGSDALVYRVTLTNSIGRLID